MLHPRQKATAWFLSGASSESCRSAPTRSLLLVEEEASRGTATETSEVFYAI